MLAIAGLGGLLYGIDIGIISAALLYLNKTINLSVQQTSLIVAAVLGGSMLSSPITGFLADWIGRKRMMIAGGLLFVASVGIIVLSHNFVGLFLGRVLQGISGGVIAVAVPLFLAETLSADTRGRGTGFFQFMLTVGIVLAALAGFFYTHQAEAAIADLAPSNWQSLGENVGVGPTCAKIAQAFMNSPEHRRNILDPSYASVGLGVVDALDRFAKSLLTLADDSLIDAYHQAWEDHRDARAEGSDNLDKAGAEGFATEAAMRARFHDYRTRYNERYP